MADIFDWSSTAGSNTTIDGINIAEGCPAGNMNGAVRSAMALVRNTFASGLQSFLAGSSALPVANGGTALTSTPSNGQVLIGNGTNYTLATITAGSGVSVTNGSGTITIAATGSGGTVTSVAISGGSTGLTTSGGPITGSGTITLSGTLAVANGGTGATTAAQARTNLGVDATPPGAVTAFAMSTPPTGWLECDGSAVSRSTYSALFSAIGTTFGSGNGSTTFNLPDLRGQFVRGWANAGSTDSGRSFGSSQTAQTGSHNHQWYTGSGGSGGFRIDCTNVGGSASTWDSSGSAMSIANDELYFDRYTSTTAANQSGDNRPVNIALMYCIKV